MEEVNMSTCPRVHVMYSCRRQRKTGGKMTRVDGEEGRLSEDPGCHILGEQMNKHDWCLMSTGIVDCWQVFASNRRLRVEFMCWRHVTCKFCFIYFHSNCCCCWYAYTSTEYTRGCVSTVLTAFFSVYGPLIQPFSSLIFCLNQPLASLNLCFHGNHTRFLPFLPPPIFPTEHPCIKK